MPNLESNALSVCPFFVRDRGNKIVCEGVLPGTLVETDFRSSDFKKEHQLFCCYSFDYAKRCSLCQAVLLKYKDE